MQNLKYYIIDGNNLIGADKSLSRFQRADNRLAREKVITLLENFLHQNKIKISLHFDGHPDEPLKSKGIKINYSYNKEADYFIRKEIDPVVNKNNVVVVSSDNAIMQYARVSGCQTKTSLDFLKDLKARINKDSEDEIINKLNNTEEFKKLFGV